MEKNWPRIKQVSATVEVKKGVFVPYSEQVERYIGPDVKTFWGWKRGLRDDEIARRVYNIDTPLRRMTASVGPLSTDLLYTVELEHWDKVISFSPRKISFRIVQDAGGDLAGGKPWVRLVTTKEGKHGPPYDECYNRAIVMLKGWGQLKDKTYFIAGWNAEETEILLQARKRACGFPLTDNTTLVAAAVVAGIAIS